LSMSIARVLLGFGIAAMRLGVAEPSLLLDVVNGETSLLEVHKRRANGGFLKAGSRDDFFDRHRGRRDQTHDGFLDALSAGARGLLDAAGDDWGLGLLGGLGGFRRGVSSAHPLRQVWAVAGWGDRASNTHGVLDKHFIFRCSAASLVGCLLDSISHIRSHCFCTPFC
jgi:hypothetical protein